MKKNIAIFIFALSSVISFPSHAQLSLRGVIDFDLPTAGSTGKALHLRADSAIQDLSRFAIGVANNGGGTDGIEYVFPSLSLSLGDDIILYRDSAAIANYFQSCFSNFEIKLQASNSISQNGDDAIELFKDSVVIETFGDINVDGTGTSWEYTDSWAYKDTLGAFWPNGWIYGGPNCTDNDTLVSTSSCPYPECAPAVQQNIHFVVDMNSPKAPASWTQPYVSGNFNSWSGDAMPMTDADGDNVWEYTAMIDQNTALEYKFTLDNWANQEQFDASTSDSLCTQDFGGFVNRVYTVGTADDTLDFCFNYCESNCTSVGFGEDNLEFMVMPNPANDVLNVVGRTSEEMTVEVISLNGRTMMTESNTTGTVKLNVSTLPRALYLVHITQGDSHQWSRVSLN